MKTREEQWDEFNRHYGEYLTRGPDKDGNTALHEATDCGYEHVALDLIKQGYDINAKNSIGVSVMDVAISPAHEPESDARVIQQALIDAGVDLHTKNKADQTLLHTAAIRGDSGMCSFLVKEGLDVNAKSYSGKTPLHDAAAMGNRGAVEQLLKSGADPSIRDNEFKIARDVSVSCATAEALDNHMMEQRLRNMPLPDLHTMLHRVGSQPREAELSVKGRKL